MNKYGFTEEEWKETLGILKKYKEVEKVVLFGSRAKNTFKPMSDVDIVLFGEKINHSLIASLQSDFEDSQIPYMFDVITYKTITSNELKEHIRIYGKTIFGEQNLCVLNKNIFNQIPFSKVLVDESISYGIVQPGAPKDLNSVPVIRVNNFSNGVINTNDIKNVASEVEAKYHRTRLKGGELLITVVGTIGATAIATKEMKDWNVARAVSVANIKKEFNSKYIQYCFKTKDIIHQMYGSTNDTVQPTLNLSSLKDLILSIPNKVIQDQIVNILTAFDDKIELLQAQNKTLETTAQTIFKEWFGKYQIGDELPEGWSLRSFYSIGDFINGSAFKSSDFSSNKEGLPIVKIAELKNGITESTAFTKKILNSKYLINNYDILFSWSGSPETSIDIFLWTNNEAYLNQHTFNVRFKDDSKKAWYYFLLKFYKPLFIQLAKMKQTTGLGHVTISNLKEYKFAHPPAFVLEETKVLFTGYYEKIASNYMQIQSLKKTRDTLLPKLMSGQLRVNDFKE